LGRRIYLSKSSIEELLGRNAVEPLKQVKPSLATNGRDAMLAQIKSQDGLIPKVGVRSGG
jgi:hypothetical protein